MDYIPLGRSGLTCPEIMVGTMTWGSQTSEAEAHQQIATALAHGLNWFDTAEMYPVNPVRKETIGNTEKIIGSYIAAQGRGDMKIATKIIGEGTAFARNGAPITPDSIREAVEASLRRLHTDYIDLYQFHWPNRGSYHFRQNWTYRPKGARSEIIDNMAACLGTLATLQDEGKIGAFGLSNESAWGTAQWLQLSVQGAGPRVATVQNEYSLMARLYDTDMAELSYHEDITLLAFSPLATGLLTGKYLNGAVPKGSRKSISPSLGGRESPRVEETVAAYIAIAQKYGIDPVHMALAWCQSRPIACMPILGATTQGQLEHGLQALGQRLPPELIEELDHIHRAPPMPY